VDAVAEKAREEQRRITARDASTRQQERDAERNLGLKLIAIGYGCTGGRARLPKAGLGEHAPGVAGPRLAGTALPHALEREMPN
jgi:hypothetical protein